MKRTRSAFATALAAWRTRAKFSQQDLDAAIGTTPGTVAQVECDRFKAPDKETCARIASALGVSRDEVWRIAMDNRLHRADPELYAEMHARIPSGDSLQEELQKTTMALEAVRHAVFRNVDVALTARRAAIREAAALVACFDGLSDQPVTTAAHPTVRDLLVDAIMNLSPDSLEAP